MTFSQMSFAQKPLSIISIEKGLKNYELLKIELLEHGFSYNSKEVQWEILMSTPDTTSLLYKKYKFLPNELEPKIVLTTSQYIAGIHIQVRRWYAKDYLDELLNNIRKYYLIKKSEEFEITTSHGKDVEKTKHYALVYSRQGSRTNVKVFDDPKSSWVIIDIMSR